VSPETARRWKIAALVALALLVAAGPFLVVWYLRTSKRGPDLDSPDGAFVAEVHYGDRDAKLCKLLVARKRDGTKIGESVALHPGEEEAKLVWLPDSSAVGYVTVAKRRVLGIVRVKSPALKMDANELSELLLRAMR
jgi:hypothetical protein